MSLPMPCTTPPLSPRTPPSPLSEKRGADGGISVPGIVLTEAGRGSTKQVVLLAPGVAYPGRQATRLGTTLRQTLVLALVALAVWHLYAALELGGIQIPVAALQP